LIKIDIEHDFDHHQIKPKSFEHQQANLDNKDRIDLQLNVCFNQVSTGNLKFFASFEADGELPL
jgi:hypothetical protein